ncbi:MAG: tRNA dihydrouridine synthase DusB [candidate division Zixibacteria bacterium]|nr:tRNA dihydrouridine synthase DusB [candidate division Zixibacteria bacterium]
MRKQLSVFAAPLAGISDTAYRFLAKHFGADYAFTEMVSAEGLVRNNHRTIDMLKKYQGEDAVGCQLFGSKPEVIAAAAEVVEAHGFDSIDLNCGCPVHKVVKKNGGAGLLKNLPLLETIIATTVKKVNIPLSLKIRSGWDDNHLNFLEVGKVAEGAGAAFICLHARTQSDKFKPESHWEHIAQLRETVSIPVIGNGGIRCAEDAINLMHQTGCDAVMVARASFGNPFIFREIKSLLADGWLTAPAGNEERVAICLEHVRLLVERFGEERAIRRSRKLLGWYCRRITSRAKIDQRLFRLNTFAEVEGYLNELLATIQENAA